jgi:hypothetical protein
MFYTTPHDPTRWRSRVTTAVVLSGLALAAACSDSTSAGRTSAQIAFTSGVRSSANAQIVPITNNGHTLNITQATLTILKVELKPTKTDACAGDDDSDDNIVVTAGASQDDREHGEDIDGEGCHELKAGPLSVDLPLDGGITTLAANAIPPGTFREIELRVSTARLVGTFDGKPFDVTLLVNSRGEIEFATPLVVADGVPTSVTINVPVGGWLTNADGSLVDPSNVASNQTLAAQIRSRIIASFRAFEDKDHDGHEDHDR